MGVSPSQSSITKLRREQVEYLPEAYGLVPVESFIDGREVTVGLVGNCRTCGAAHACQSDERRIQAG